MSFKSWLMPVLPMIIGLSFTVVTFVTGVEVTESHVHILDYLLVLTLGTGAIGAGKSGFKKYSEFRSKAS